jgi:hypothetical protein
VNLWKALNRISLIGISAMPALATNWINSGTLNYNPDQVGIGASSFSGRFMAEANGTPGAPGAYPASGEVSYWFRSNAGDGPATESGDRAIFRVDASRIGTADANASRARIFEVTNDNGTILSVKGNSQVGINTATPSRTLDVNGTFRASAIEGNSQFPVINYGASVSNTDNTAAFQAAIDAAWNAGGGIVLVPTGQFNLTGNLELKSGITLQGVWTGPHDSHINVGSTLLVNRAPSDSNGTPFITMWMNCAVKGLTIYYPQQSFTNPQPYPWTISGQINSQIIDVTLPNTFQGIKLGTSILGSNNHYVRDVHMSAIQTGVQADMSLDVSRLINVHINSWFWRTAASSTSQPMDSTQQEVLNAYTKSHLTGFRFYRVDWEEVTGCFVIWAKNGFQFLKNPNESVMAHVSFNMGGADDCVKVLDVQQVNSQMGITFNSVVFSVGEALISTLNSGPVRFNNCDFVYGQNYLIRNLGTGVVAVTNGNFLYYQTAIYMAKGKLLVSNSTFSNPGTPRVILSTLPANASASFVGNAFLDGYDINSQPNLLKSNNLF